MLFARWVLRLPKIFANVQRMYQIAPPEMLICLKNIILSKKSLLLLKMYWQMAVCLCCIFQVKFTKM